MTPLPRPLSPVSTLPSPLERRRVPVPAANCRLQLLDYGSRCLQVLSVQRPPDQDPLDRFGQVEPRAPEWGVEERNPPAPAPRDDLRTMVTLQVIPDQRQSDRWRGAPGPPHLHGLFRPAPIRPLPPRGEWVLDFGQRLQDGGKPLLEPRVEYRVRRLFHSLGSDLSGLGIKQRQ